MKNLAIASAALLALGVGSAFAATDTYVSGAPTTGTETYATPAPTTAPGTYAYNGQYGEQYPGQFSTAPNGQPQAVTVVPGPAPDADQAYQGDAPGGI